MVEVHVCLRVLNTKKKEKYEGGRSTMKHATSHAQLLLCTGGEEFRDEILLVGEGKKYGRVTEMLKLKIVYLMRTQCEFCKISNL